MEAEDVAQETFLRILEAAPRYQPNAAFLTYFYRTLAHLCIDRARKRQLISIEDIPEVANPAYLPVDKLIERERRAQIRDALDTLPSKQKAAIILNYYKYLSYVEIAQVLGVTPKSVERLISRARTSLQARLSHLSKK